jgi:hypothetical protein
MSDSQLAHSPQELRNTAWNTVASYATYLEAQNAVDLLAATNFPVDELEIVGSGLRSVEQVTGRMNWVRAVVGGAASGAWIGLFVGIVVGLFDTGSSWTGLVVGGLLIGAAWGTLYGLSVRYLSGGRHNFSSLQSIVATQYDVIARDRTSERARIAIASAHSTHP